MPYSSLYSSHLRGTIRRVEFLTGRRIAIQKLEGTEPADNLAQGFHARQGNTDRVWLDMSLSPPACEATAAHELAHIVQRAQGYPHVEAGDEGDRRLAHLINNLVLDVHADRWALAAGFEVGKALAESSLPELTAMLKSQRGSGGRALDKNGSLALGVDYAAFKLRLERFGLFAGLEREITYRWPEAAQTGRELWKALARYRFSSAASCLRAMKRALEVLGIPRDRVRVV